MPNGKKLSSYDKVALKKNHGVQFYNVTQMPFLRPFGEKVRFLLVSQTAGE